MKQTIKAFIFNYGLTHEKFEEIILGAIDLPNGNLQFNISGLYFETDMRYVWRYNESMLEEDERG